MRATVEYHGIDSDYPPIKVVIADGSDNEDVIIKVSDEGGGIPRSNMKRIWSYVSFIRCRISCNNGYKISYILILDIVLASMISTQKVIHNCRSRNPRGDGSLQRKCRS